MTKLPDAKKKSESSTSNRLIFLDFVRTAAMLSVVFYHSVAAYSTMAPWWPIHDGISILADSARQVLDVFMMPVFFCRRIFHALLASEERL